METDFKNAPILSGFNVWTPAAVLRVVGDDALTFLQGQFTNDLRGGAVVRYGLWLDQKGRVVADSVVRVVSSSEVWIVSEFVNAELITRRLEAYVIADDVVIEDQTAAYVGLTVVGETAEGWATARGVGLPAAGAWTAAAGGWLVVARRGVAAAWDWVGPRTDFSLPNGPELDVAVLRRARIVAGVPQVPVEIGATDLPNEGGLEVEAISFTKGCYLGQEVMARLKNLGQIRRRLVRVAGAGGPPEALPVPLFQGSKRVGELRSAVDDGVGGWVGMAMVTRLGLLAERGLAWEADGADVVGLKETP